MCGFLSAIVLRNGDVLMHPFLDSHADLAAYFRVPDTSSSLQPFAKVELVPSDNWLDPSSWVFRLDEETAPRWWGDVKNGAEQTLRDRATQMVLRAGRVPILCDGVWILGGDAVVQSVRLGARIVRVQDEAQIHNVGGGTFSGVRGGTFSDVWGGTFSGVRGGTFSGVRGGTFSGVWGGTFSDVGGGTFSGVWGGTFSDVWGGTFSDVWGGTFSGVWGGTFSGVWGGTFSGVRGGTQIRPLDGRARDLVLDDSARAHLVARTG